jgi:hypothetical protein
MIARRLLDERRRLVEDAMFERRGGGYAWNLSYKAVYVDCKY